MAGGAGGEPRGEEGGGGGGGGGEAAASEESERPGERERERGGRDLFICFLFFFFWQKGRDDVSCGFAGPRGEAFGMGEAHLGGGHRRMGPHRIGHAAGSGATSRSTTRDMEYGACRGLVSCELRPPVGF